MTARRSAKQLRVMREAGRVVAEMHERIRAAAKPGTTTLTLDRVAREVLASRGATSNFLGYGGFPAVICASPNSVVVHGIPDLRPLEDGDILSIDCGAVVEGWHGDAAFTMGIGEISEEARRLIEVTEASLAAGLGVLRDGARLGDLGAEVESTVDRAGFTVVRNYVGHGIGRAMHELPDVPNYGKRGSGQPVRAGMTLAVEPMVVAGSARTQVQADGWTVVTRDGSLAAHAEHTVAVTECGYEILTDL